MVLKLGKKFELIIKQPVLLAVIAFTAALLGFDVPLLK